MYSVGLLCLVHLWVGGSSFWVVLRVWATEDAPRPQGTGAGSASRSPQVPGAAAASSRWAGLWAAGRQVGVCRPHWEDALQGWGGGRGEAAEASPGRAAGRGSRGAGPRAAGRAVRLRGGGRELPAGAVLLSAWQPPPPGRHRRLSAPVLSLRSQSTGSLSPPWKKM